MTDQIRCQCRTSQGCAQCGYGQQDGNLPAARTRLQDAISAAIDPKPEHIDGQTHWLDPLYTQIRAAVACMRKGASTHAFGSQPPGWVDAMDLLRDIDHQTIAWEPRRQLYPYHPIIDTPMRLQVIEKQAWRPQDVTTMDTISGWLEGWAKRVDKLFAPEPVKHLASPCPACGTRWVYREDAGEMVRQPALQITTHGCTCQKCRHVWAPEYFTHLARVLGYELPEGVLE